MKKFSALSSPLAGPGGNSQRLAVALIIRYSQAINPGRLKGLSAGSLTLTQAVRINTSFSIRCISSDGNGSAHYR